MSSTTPGITNRYIRVKAPATLEENFTFDILVDGQPVTVVVPSGGVTEGEEFEVPYDGGGEEEEEDDDDDDDDDEGDDVEAGNCNKQGEGKYDDGQNEEALHGKFRVSLCSCCDVVTQSTFWMALCCLPVMLAQLLTRLGLKWNGQAIPFTRRIVDGEDENDDDDCNHPERLRKEQDEKTMTFNKIVLVFLGALMLGHIPVVGSFLVLLFYLVTVVWIGGNLRRYMRQRYRIPNTMRLMPNGLADRCTMCWCGCCAAIQMARHTHNDKEYPGSCCTTTGL